MENIQGTKDDCFNICEGVDCSQDSTPNMHVKVLTDSRWLDVVERLTVELLRKPQPPTILVVLSPKK